MRGWEVISICMVGLFVSAAAGLAADAPQTPSQAPLPLPPVGHLVSLSVAPHEFSGSTSMHPGTHLMDEPLRLQVTSHYPGWYMHIQATSLKGPDDEIGPEDIHIVTEQAGVALDQPQPVVQSGDGGETILEVLFELRTTKYHKPGAYRGQLLVIAGYPQGLPPQVVKIPIEVEVACWLSGSIAGNKMYFHYGLPGESLSAIAEGQISADTRVCLSLSAACGRVDCLPMVRPFSGQKRCSDAAIIPLVWELRENGTGWRRPDRISFNGKEMSWELASSSEKVFYEIQCCPQPDAAQAPGDYAMRVILTVMPVL